MNTPSTAPHTQTRHLDTGPLSWVIGEITESLTRVRTALAEALAQGTKDADTGSTALRQARSWLHQVHGALQIVDIEGVDILSATLEELLERFDSGKTELNPASLEAVELASQALVEYLGELLLGQPNQPLKLFPYYRVLLEICGAERIHPADLFFPDVTRRPTLPVRTDTKVLSVEEYASLRKRFEWALLLYLKGGERSEQGATTMRDVLQEVENAQSDPQMRVFWWVMAGVAEAVAGGHITGDLAVRQLFARINLQMRRLGSGSASIAERLLRDALFFIARIGNPSPKISEIRAAYHLDGLLPTDYETLRYGKVDSAALADARAHLSHAKTLWNRIVGGDATALAAFKRETSALSKAGEGLHVAALSGLLHELDGIAQHVAVQATPDEMLGLEIAIALLFVEQALQQVNHLPDDFSARADAVVARLLAAVAGEILEPASAPQVNDMSHQVQQQQSMMALSTELQALLRQVEKELDVYFREPLQKEGLGSVDDALRQIYGALAVLDHDHAMRAVQHVQEAVRGFVAIEGEPAAEQVKQVVQNISALSFFIETFFLHGQASHRFDFDEESGIFRANLAGSNPQQAQDRKDEGGVTDNDAASKEAAWTGNANPSSTVATVEDDLNAHRKQAQQLGESLQKESDNLQLQAQLKEALEQVSMDAYLLDRQDIGKRARAVIDMMASPTFDASRILEEISLLTVERAVQHKEEAPVQPVPENDAVIDAELLDIFLGEAVEVLDCITETLPLLRKATNNQEYLTTLRRSFHTLKGSGRMVGLNAFGEAAWGIEQVLNLRLADTQAADPELFALIENAVQILASWVEDLQRTGTSSQNGQALYAAACRVKEGQAFVLEEVPVKDTSASTPTEEVEAVKASEALNATQDEESANAASTSWTQETPLLSLPDLDVSETFAESTDNTDAAADSAALEEVEDIVLELDEEEREQFGHFLFDAVVSKTDDTSGTPDTSDTLTASSLAPTPDTDSEVERVEPSLPEETEEIVLSEEELSQFGHFLSTDSPEIGDEVQPDADAPEVSALLPEESSLTDAVSLVSEGVEEAKELALSTEELEQFGHFLSADVGETTDENTMPALLQDADEYAVPDFSAAPLEEDNVGRVGNLEVGSPLHGIFLAEADELVHRLEHDFHEWKNEVSRDASMQALHAAHSLAGSSGTVGLQPVRHLAHALEMLLQYLTRKPHKLLPDEHEVLNETLVAMRSMLGKFSLGEMPEEESILVAQLDAMPEAFEERAADITPPETSEQVMDVAEASGISGMPDASDVSHTGSDAFMAAQVEQEKEEDDDAALFLRDELDADLLPIFVEEGRDMLPQIGETLRAWQDKPDDRAVQQTLLRMLHTVKGSARMAGAMILGQHLHDMETRIEVESADNQAVSLPVLEELLASYDVASHMFEQLQVEKTSVADVALADVEAEGTPVAQQVKPVEPLSVDVVAEPEKPAATQAEALQVRVRADVLDRVVNQAGEVSISRSRLESEVGAIQQSLGDLAENISRLREQLREIELQAESQITSRMSSASGHEFDPLEFDRFTRLQELTRMMAESVGDISSVQQTLSRTVESANVGLLAQAQLTRDLQQDLMRVRMVKFASVADRLYRVTRQAAKETDKRVNLDIRGSGVEIDRGVLEKMAGSFEHLLRNAVVHGIEPAAYRRATGKEETGELRIEVTQDGNEVILRFTDDGQGLNTDSIRQKAEKIGLITEEASLSDDEVNELIFHPGFTTVEKVTELAGRGVGMDVVRTEAASLGGRVTVTSQVGGGTQFNIYLPLTLAVTQVVLLSTGGRIYAVSSSMVEQVQHLKSGLLSLARNEGALMWQSERIPMHYLPTLLGDRDQIPVTQQYSPVLILRSGSERVAILVDEIVGNREVVVKNIGPQLSRMIGIVGATVLGSGDIVLILNPVPLVRRAEQEGIRMPLPVQEEVVEVKAAADDATGDNEEITDPATMPHAIELQASPAKPAPVARTQPVVMVVDDSLTVRRVTQRMLAREGYQVVLAKDGVDALENLQSITPDVMLVDIEMPRMDGFDLTRNVRDDERTRDIPIIMITSRTASKHRDFAMGLGVNEYLGKPYQEDKLLALVAGFAGKTVTVN